MLGLYWSDIHKGAVTVQRAVKKGKKISPDLKTNQAYRTIPLPPETVAELTKLKADREKKKVVNLTTAPLVFPGRDGQPYEPLAITRFFARLCSRQGVDADLYDLRHTYATNLARAGVHPAKIQYLMGHSRPTMALDAYTHIQTNHVDDVAAILAESIKVVDLVVC